MLLHHYIKTNKTSPISISHRHARVCLGFRQRLEPSAWPFCIRSNLIWHNEINQKPICIWTVTKIWNFFVGRTIIRSKAANLIPFKKNCWLGIRGTCRQGVHPFVTSRRYFFPYMCIVIRCKIWLFNYLCLSRFCNSAVLSEIQSKVGHSRK